MKDYRQLFGIAAIIMACSFLVRSFQPAHAINGPSVSMGSNPYESFWGVGSYTITLDSNYDFIITTAFHQFGFCSLRVNGVLMNAHSGTNINFFKFDSQYYYTNSSFTTGNAHLRIPAGSSIEWARNDGSTSSCDTNPNSGYSGYIEGYYIHTP